MNKTKSFALLLVSSLVLFGQGCLGGGAPTDDGGMWLSTDSATTWLQINKVPTAKGVVNLNQMNIYSLTQDPQDDEAVYAGTSSGYLYSYDGGISWDPAKDKRLQGVVTDIAVHPKEKCTVYVASGKSLLKTQDCSRTFEEMYVGDVEVLQLEIDHYNPEIVWLGTAVGEILRSDNNGTNWTTIERLGSKIVSMVVDPSDSRVIYVSTDTKGIYRTTDKGFHWEDIDEPSKELLKGADHIVGVAQDKKGENFYMAVRDNLYHSTDKGNTWSKLTLVTTERKTRIYSLAVDPNDGRKVYYGSATTFYASDNIGNTWRTVDLPSIRAATALMIDAGNGNNYYLGVTKLEQ
ncbi:MAG: hypothetical protein ACD_76C00134G0002 [uncultured bacterium]|nr:MAG: hypothetical protein ACD_76C00134G0002 [uncultured bacterium]HBD04831.1 hypothetical protein [Candidatus Uhrbacteria bacterium]